MDRNVPFDVIRPAIDIVALRKESVDRNLWWGVRKAVGSLVALRKESVDRNGILSILIIGFSASLSARRAWIEIDWASVITAMTSVALRKESVDRNSAMQIVVIVVHVALRKESVDRNSCWLLA